jgi:hypothetical protein
VKDEAATRSAKNNNTDTISNYLQGETVKNAATLQNSNKKATATNTRKEPAKSSGPKAHVENDIICIDSSDDDEVLPSANKKPTTHFKHGEKKDDMERTNIDFLQSACWKCNVQLRHPDQETRRDLCCYAMHTHPLLQVPMCCVCSEEVAAAEVQDDDESCCCSTCGRDEDEVETFFLCDGAACRRAICKMCLLQAHGNDAGVVTQLLGGDDTWRCCICDPPAPLQALQKHLTELQERPETSSKSKEDLLIELQVIEQKKQECVQLLEQEEETRAAVRQELAETDIPPTEVDQHVEEEMHVWREQQEKHEVRLADMISTLQDKLESRHNFNLKHFYYVEKQLTGEPAWRQAADKAIAIREQQDLLNLEPPKHNPLCDLDDPQDIEELASLTSKDDSSREDFSAQWRHFRFKVTQPDIHRAFENEDEYLFVKQIPVECRRKESDDRQAMLEEDRQRSYAHNIRRDHVVAIRRRRDKEEEGSKEIQRARQDLSVAARKTAAYPAVVRLTAARRAQICEEEEEETHAVDPTPDDAGLFVNSSLVLTEDDNDHRLISIARPLAEKLKPHQKEGIQFMFLNSFSDLACKRKAPEANQANKVDIGGCILAHNMGLGKNERLCVWPMSWLTFCLQRMSFFPKQENLCLR